MTREQNKTRGFTLLEIMIVVILITISIGFSVLYAQTSQVRADLDAQVSSFISYIRLAQSQAQAGLDDETHGISLSASSYTIFSGSAYNPLDPENYTINLPSTVTIQNIALNGGGSEIYFAPPHGETTNYGTLDFISSSTNKTITITITSIGTINH